MSKNTKEKARHIGTFDLGPRKKLAGELRLKGRATSLRIFHSEEIPRFDGSIAVHGELADLRKVTCIDCIPNSSRTVHGSENRRAHHADMFPHFVAVGDQHIFPDEPSIEKVHFTVDDVTSLFYDFDAFSSVNDAKSLIKAAVAANGIDREIPIGEHPIIAYFAGRCEIVNVPTEIGTFTVNHRPTYGAGGPAGVNIKNQLVIGLEPISPITFNDTIDRLMILIHFLSALAGRRQAPRSIELKLSGEKDPRMRPLRLHWSYRPKGNKDRKGESQNAPSPGDIPLNAIGRGDEFASVLQHWIAREPAWRIARVRYADCLQQGNSYDANRLVAAANMFDLLPKEAVPLDLSLSAELATAQKAGLVLFKGLPESIQRNSVIQALRLMDRPSLTKKVLYRVSIVDERLGHQFPDLAIVAKIAIKVRNHFVHGESDFEFEKVRDFQPFFTDALEFIFYASDLIEAGWNPNVWSKDPHGWGHSFTRFRSKYKHELSDFKIAVATSERTKADKSK